MLEQCEAVLARSTSAPLRRRLSKFVLPIVSGSKRCDEDVTVARYIYFGSSYFYSYEILKTSW